MICSHRAPSRVIRSFTLWIVLLVLLGQCGRALAEPQPPPLCTEEHRLDVGQKAPCSGIHAPTATYSSLLARDAQLEDCENQRRLDADEHGVKLSTEQRRRSSCEEARAACEARAAPVCPRLPEPPPRWSRPGVWAGLGAVAVAVVGIVTSGEHPAWWALAGAGGGFAVAHFVW